MLRFITSYYAFAAARSSNLESIDLTPLLFSPPVIASFAASRSCFSSLYVAAGRPSNIQLTPSLSSDPCLSSSIYYHAFFWETSSTFVILQNTYLSAARCFAVLLARLQKTLCRRQTRLAPPPDETSSRSLGYGTAATLARSRVNR